MRHSLNKISSQVIAIGLILMVAVVFTCPDPTWAAVKKPKKVTSLKVTKTTYNSVKLKWKKASRAKKYIVYRSLKKDSGYKKIAKVKKTSFTDKNLQTGQKYWYSVRAVGKKHKKGKRSKRVSAVPKLETPSFQVSGFYEGIQLDVGAVSGATGYKVKRDGEFLTDKRSYLDEDTVIGESHEYSVVAYREANGKTYKSDVNGNKTAARQEINVKLNGANKVENPHFKGYSYSIRGSIDSTTYIKKVEIGVTNEIDGEWASDTTHYKKSKVNKRSFSLSGAADNAVRFGTLAEGTYYYTIIATLTDGSVWELRHQKFEVIPEPEPVYPASVTTGAKNAIKWAKQIANDDSFTYGKGSRSHHGGCYYCGTNVNGPKKAKKGSKWEKTYCCNPFIFAAYAHGAKDPAILKACKRGECGGMTPKDWIKYGCFAKVGQCKKVAFSKLLPGDVILSDKKKKGQWHHVIMYIGDDRYVDAGWEGWGSNTIGIRSGMKETYKKHFKKYSSCYVMRYTGK